MGNKLIIEYSAQYKDLPCNGFVDNTAKAVIERSIESVLGSIPCITTHICSRDNINSSIICHGQQKNKRSTGLAAITMKMSVNPQAGTWSFENYNSFRIMPGR